MLITLIAYIKPLIIKTLISVKYTLFKWPVVGRTALAFYDVRNYHVTEYIKKNYCTEKKLKTTELVRWTFYDMPT